MIEHERTGGQPVDEAFPSASRDEHEHASGRVHAVTDDEAVDSTDADRSPSPAPAEEPGGSGINVPAWVSPFEQPHDRAADAVDQGDQGDEADPNEPADLSVHIHPSVHDLIGKPAGRERHETDVTASPSPEAAPAHDAPDAPAASIESASPQAQAASVEPEAQADEPMSPSEPATNAVAPAPASSPPAEASGPTVPPPDLTRRRPLRVIALMNQKGGVGKTTSTANLGAALAAQGERVLLVDLDPQAHLTLHVGVEPDDLEESIYDLLVDDDKQAWEVAVEVNPNLYILPAEVNLAGAESELAPRMIDGRAQRRLRDKVLPLVEGRIPRIARPDNSPADPLDPRDRPFDYVLIDCPPSLGLLTINALIFAREVFVPMQAHFLALQGLSKLLDTCRHVQTGFNPHLKVSGVILCMHEGQTILASEVVSDLSGFLEQSRGDDVPWRDAVVFQPAIRRNIKLAECPSYGQTIFDYAPGCAGAADYAGLAQAVIRQTAGARS